MEAGTSRSLFENAIFGNSDLFRGHLYSFILLKPFDFDSDTHLRVQ